MSSGITSIEKKVISVLDNKHAKALPSPPLIIIPAKAGQAAESEEVGLKGLSAPHNYVKALVQVMFEQGDINRPTYEKAVAKLVKEVEKLERKR